MNIIILGASGLIGRAVVHRLASKHAVTVAGRHEPKLRRTFPRHDQFMSWDQLKKKI